MAGRLRDAGYRLSSRVDQSDVVIVHTCGFIEDAKKESVQGILEVCEATKEKEALTGRRIPVLVTGCLSQRYHKDLLKEIPEIAGVAGTSAPRDIVEIVEATLSGKRLETVGTPGRGAPTGGVRAPVHEGATWAYLRVSEGCRHHCTYCAIPSMRGPLVSRRPEDVVSEAKALAEAGVRELNLIAQDLSDYGFDLTGKRLLPQLVRDLASIPKIAWVRLLYVRPDGVTNELADAMALPKVAPYVDLPAEHGSGSVLRRMGRPGPHDILKAVETLRSRVPGLFVRTTIITGFPGETVRDIEETMALLKAMDVHRVGVFPYSMEEGTPACRLPDPVPPEVAKERAESLRLFGLALARRSSECLIGKRIPVLPARPSSRRGYLLGRGPHQAPEVDGLTYVRVGENTTPGLSSHLSKGPIPVRVNRAGALDLFATPDTDWSLSSSCH